MNNEIVNTELQNLINVLETKFTYKGTNNSKPLTSKTKNEKTNTMEKKELTNRLKEGVYVIKDSKNKNLWTFIYRKKPPKFLNYKKNCIIINHIEHY